MPVQKSLETYCKHQVLLSNINSFIYAQLNTYKIVLSNTNNFIFKQLNVFKHCYVALIIQFKSHLFAHS